MHVILVPAPRIEEQKTVHNFPLGVLSLHRVLSDAGHDSRVYVPVQDRAPQAEPEAVIRRWAADIVATRPDWVGFSTMCSTYPLILLLARAVKELSPLVQVVLGGPQASAVAEESMAAFQWIDFVVRGEAENAIVDLSQVIAGGKTPGEAPSLTYRSNGGILSTPLGTLLPDLDSLPLPDYREYSPFDQALRREFPVPGLTYLPLEPGRGCPYGCTFCSTSAFWRRRCRQKSPRLLTDQIETIVSKYGVKSVYLVQDLLPEHRDWIAGFLRAMENSGAPNWRCFLRGDSAVGETLVDMQRAGCTHIFLGVESGSQRTQKLIRKNLDLARTRKTVEEALACGMAVKTSFILGFPWETAQDVQDTLSLHNYFLSIGVEESQVRMLCPLPKTQITMKYASWLRLDTEPSSVSQGLEGFRTPEIEAMIREFPQIFSSFYYVEPEFVSREELLTGVWAGEALSHLSQGRNSAK